MPVPGDTIRVVPSGARWYQVAPGDTGAKWCQASERRFETTQCVRKNRGQDCCRTLGGDMTVNYKYYALFCDELAKVAPGGK